MKHTEKIVFLCMTFPENRNSTRYQRGLILTENYSTALIYRGNLSNSIKSKFHAVYRSHGKLFFFAQAFLFLAYLRIFKKYKIIYTQFNTYGSILGFFSKKILHMFWIHDLWNHPSQEFELCNRNIPRLLKKATYEIVVKKILQHADSWIIAMHEGIYKYLPQRLPNTSLLKITNGVDLPIFDKLISERTSDYNSEKPQGNQYNLKICYVGSITKERGVHLILSWLKSYNGSDLIDIVFAGPTNNETLELFANYQKEMPESVTIQMLGILSHQEAIQIINKSDVCLCILNTNILNYNYAYPIKLFEYLALGKIVIATKTPGICEVIQDGINGFLISNEIDKLDLTIQKIIGLRKNGSLVEMETHARETARRYSWDGINKSIISHLDNYRSLNFTNLP